MRSCVIRSGVETGRYWHRGANLHAWGKRAFVNSDTQYDELAKRLLRIQDSSPAAFPLESTCIADLSPRLRVERGWRQNHIALGAVMKRIRDFITDKDRLNGGFDSVLVI